VSDNARGAAPARRRRRGRPPCRLAAHGDRARHRRGRRRRRGAVTPSFLSVDNIRAILRNAAIVGIVAVGMTPVTLSGNFVYLGITQSAMLAMVAFVAMLGAGWGVVPAVIAVILLLVAVGMLQGAIIAAGLNPVITTLAAGAIIFGVVSELTRGGIVRAGGNAIDWDQASIAGVPVEVLIFIFTALVVRHAAHRHRRETTPDRRQPRHGEISGIRSPRHHSRLRDLFRRPALAGIINGAAFGQATAVSFPA
jgi:ribose transport system permease protein